MDGGAAGDLGMFKHAGDNAAEDARKGVDPGQFIKDHEGLVSEFIGKTKELLKKHFGSENE
jgi:hypothetical protein